MDKKLTGIPLVCVLILNWNGNSITIDCVNSVLKSDYLNFNVVIIDNGSSADNVKGLKEYFGENVTILENRVNLGYAGGFNVGLKYGFEEKKADYCLVMNNDTIIDPTAISELIKAARTDSDAGFVTGKVYYYDRPNVLQTVGKKEDPVRWNGGHIGMGEEDKGQHDEVCERYFIDDVFTLVSSSLYRDTKGYNPMFFLESEEFDWQARAKKLGYKNIYTPHAKLWHRGSATMGKNSAVKAYFDARNPMLVILLHKDPVFFRRYFWSHLGKNVFRSSLASVKHGDISVAIAKWKGFFSGLSWGFKNKEFKIEHFI